jgi:type IV pilus assembly protein PilV
MKLRKQLCHQVGFSLVEVMVAVVIICIGLLGIAKIEALSLSDTTMSRERALAAIEAASIASAMHSNRNYWTQLETGLTLSIGVNPTSGGPAVVTVTDATLQGPLESDLSGNLQACVGVAGVTSACPVAANLAAYDLARWWAYSVSVQLPNPTASISCPEVPPGTQAPITCKVQIQWIEKSVAVNSNEATVEEAQASNNPLLAASASENPTFTLYVQP